MRVETDEYKMKIRFNTWEPELIIRSQRGQWMFKWGKYNEVNFEHVECVISEISKKGKNM